MPSFDLMIIGRVVKSIGTWEGTVEIEDGIGLTGGDETMGGEDVFEVEGAGRGDTM